MTKLTIIAAILAAVTPALANIFCDVLDKGGSRDEACSIAVNWPTKNNTDKYLVSIFDSECKLIGGGEKYPYRWGSEEKIDIKTNREGWLLVETLAPAQGVTPVFPDYNLAILWRTPQHGYDRQYGIGTKQGTRDGDLWEEDENCICKENCLNGEENCCACKFWCPTPAVLGEGGDDPRSRPAWDSAGPGYIEAYDGPRHFGDPAWGWPEQPQ